MLFGEFFHPQAANTTIGFFKTGAVQGPSSPGVAGFTVSGIVTASDGTTGLRNVRVTLTETVLSGPQQPAHLAFMRLIMSLRVRAIPRVFRRGSIASNRA